MSENGKASILKVASVLLLEALRHPSKDTVISRSTGKPIDDKSNGRSSA